jgi:hypothetical protein
VWITAVFGNTKKPVSFYMFSDEENFVFHNIHAKMLFKTQCCHGKMFLVNAAMNTVHEFVIEKCFLENVYLNTQNAEQEFLFKI